MEMQSLLLTTFRRAVDAFNNCQKKGDYTAKVRPFLHEQVIIEEFDFPNRRHTGGDNSVDYLDCDQSTYLPRFHPDYKNVVETPQNSDQAVYAWVSGPGTYKDKDSDPPETESQCYYFFQFRRNTTSDDWAITFASARSTIAALDEGERSSRVERRRFPIPE